MSSQCALAPMAAAARMERSASFMFDKRSGLRMAKPPELAFIPQTKPTPGRTSRGFWLGIVSSVRASWSISSVLRRFTLA